jgi:pimeloyl-ACP methyl ester carboxylesterase
MSIGKKIAVKYLRAKFTVLSALSKSKAAEKAFDLFCTPQYRNKKTLPPVFQKAEKINFVFEGNRIKGYRFNHPAKARILITHGFESTVLNFDRYVNPLIKKGYEVLAFDAPAHGHSSGKRINVLLYKNMLHYINRHYGPFHGFMGHSLGGLALSLFLAETEHDVSTQLVLIAPATETTTAIDNYFSFLQIDKGVRKEFDELITRITGQKPDSISVSRAAKNIKARVLFLQDKEDDLTPYSDVEPLLLKNYPHFKFIISKGLGHSRIYRDTESFKTIIDFFDDQPE